MCEMKLGEVGGVGKVGEVILAKHAKHAISFLLPRQFYVFSSFSASLLANSEFIFWSKRPLTASPIQKAVSRTLKQSDIVLYAGGDAGVGIFEDGEAFIQICEKGGDVE